MSAPPALRRFLRRAAPACLLLLAVFCWRYALGACAALELQANLAAYRGAEKNASAYEAMLEMEQRALPPRPFALWAEQNAIVQASVTKRSREVHILRILGDTRLVLPVPETLAPDDINGCLLDEDTAMALFQSTNVIGSTVLIGDRTYTVRGVLAAPPGTVLIRPEKDAVLQNVAMRGKEAAAEFGTRHGLQLLPVQPGFYAGAARLFSQLPVLFCLLAAFFLLGRAARSAAAYPLRYALVLIARFGLATCCALYLLSMFPSAYLPSRWSDFRQYTAMFASIREVVEAYFMAEKLLPDRLLTQLLLQSALGLCAAVCVPLAYHLGTLAQLHARLEVQEAKLARKHQFSARRIAARRTG